MESMVQNYLDVDFCDKCDAEIREGETVYLDVKREHAGVIPAYCSECAKSRAEQLQLEAVKELFGEMYKDYMNSRTTPSWVLSGYMPRLKEILEAEV